MMINTLLDVLIPIAWLLLATGVWFYIWRTRRRHGLRVAVKQLFSYRLIVPLAMVLSLTIVRAALVFVYPHQIGVVVSIFLPGGIRSQPLRGGLHWIVPLAERVTIYPIYHQTLTMSRHPNENQFQQDDSIRARTSDGQVVTMDATVIFRVDPDEDEVVQLHIQWQDRYVRDLLRPAMRSTLRDGVALYTVEEVNSDKRADFVERFETSMQKRSKGSGILIESVYIRNIGFSDEYAVSVEQKQMAYQGMTRAQYEAKQIENLSRGKAERIKILASGEAVAIVIEAKAAAEARVLMAQAEAEALRLVGAALNHREDLLTFRYIEKLSPKIRAMLLPSNTPLILPLPQLDAEMVPTEKAYLERVREPDSPDTKPVPVNQAPSLTSSAPDRRAP
jgi:regulator of protease activity HflC (stomatin/prohibitin superfamily)